MKKETLQQIFKRSLTKDAMDMIFITPKQMLPYTSQRIREFKATTSSPEKQMMNVKNSFGIKVQSVALPIEHQLFSLKSEAQVLDWLQNKIHNVNTAFYKINSKYDGDTERVNWNNNKTQNPRFLEIKNLYKERKE